MGERMRGNVRMVVLADQEGGEQALDSLQCTAVNLTALLAPHASPACPHACSPDLSPPSDLLAAMMARLPCLAALSPPIYLFKLFNRTAPSSHPRASFSSSASPSSCSAAGPPVPGVVPRGRAARD